MSTEKIKEKDLQVALSDVALREMFVNSLRMRLIGPAEEYEELEERPHKRYLTGMIFPKGCSPLTLSEPDGKDEEGRDVESTEEDPGSPIDMVFQKLPASTGITFALADGESSITVEVNAATYERAAPDHAEKSLNAPSKKGLKVWKRRPCSGPAKFTFGEITTGTATKEVLDGHASLQLFVRRSRGRMIATLSLVNNRATGEGEGTSVPDILFQVGMTCTPSLGVPGYPDPEVVSPDKEAEELALQYRALPTFAVGHGCGVFWPEASGDTVSYVAIDYLPALEVPPVTADIGGLPGNTREGLDLTRLQDPAFDPLPGLYGLLATYSEWFDETAAGAVPERFRDPKKEVLQQIGLVIGRIRDGIELLQSTPDALRIFRMANRAMLLSTARTNANRDRQPGYTYRDVSLADIPVNTIRWRPFQLAFFLLALRGLWDPEHPDRGTADLIWFPTGGGKTEAYLAVAAFEMLRRRFVEGERGYGTAVIKRYTLRLLTIQQFERAGSLICALETLRYAGEIPGSEPFSLGLWVGEASSPNTFDGREGALRDLERIRASTGAVDGVRVPLKQCPVCATPIIPGGKPEGLDGVGLRETSAGHVELFCPNDGCSYHGGLPISYIDEHLYANPPTMLLGTVDKFAMLAWKDEARAFFGTDRNTSPPSLIIQDELHLISGPLGTLDGSYEAAMDTAISTLGKPAKYICATATIRRAGDQIRKLYGKQASIFPPPGVDARDSFFSRTVSDAPGRLYIGGMGQGHTPTFSNVIASTALLAAGGAVREYAGNRADTWWTLVSYQNSKRELGKTLSLAKDDIPARLHALGEKRRITGGGVREVSGNLKDSEIPMVLQELSVDLPAAATLDFVACTNMLSVGVDVQRLGLMLVNGQPKTVAEYIQASSRVGRDARRPPGIVFALLSPSKPRDRSHYEFFRAFHQGYYRHVEPTSVTPYAPPARERSLHGAFVALVRMVSDVHANNDASGILRAEEDVRQLADRFLDRVEASGDCDDGGHRDYLLRFLDEWISKAKTKGRNLRFKSSGKQHAGLMHPFGNQGDGRETLQSLRHVDSPLKLILPDISAVQTGDKA